MTFLLKVFQSFSRQGEGLNLVLNCQHLSNACWSAFVNKETKPQAQPSVGSEWYLAGIQRVFSQYLFPYILYLWNEIWVFHHVVRQIFLFSVSIFKQCAYLKKILSNCGDQLMASYLPSNAIKRSKYCCEGILQM